MAHFTIKYYYYYYFGYDDVLWVCSKTYNVYVLVCIMYSKRRLPVPTDHSGGYMKNESCVLRTYEGMGHAGVFRNVQEHASATDALKAAPCTCTPHTWPFLSIRF